MYRLLLALSIAGMVWGSPAKAETFDHNKPEEQYEQQSKDVSPDMDGEQKMDYRTCMQDAEARGRHGSYHSYRSYMRLSRRKCERRYPGDM